MPAPIYIPTSETARNQFLSSLIHCIKRCIQDNLHLPTSPTRRRSSPRYVPT